MKTFLVFVAALLLAGCTDNSIPVMGSVEVSVGIVAPIVEPQAPRERYEIAPQYLMGADLDKYNQVLRAWDLIQEQPHEERYGSWDIPCLVLGLDEQTEINCLSYQGFAMQNAWYAQQYISQSCGTPVSPTNLVYTQDLVDDARYGINEYFHLNIRSAPYSNVSPTRRALMVAKRIKDRPSFDHDGRAGLFAAILIILEDQFPMSEHNNSNCPNGNCPDDDMQELGQIFAIGVGGSLGGLAMDAIVTAAALNPVGGAIVISAAVGVGGMAGYACFESWCNGESLPESPEALADSMDPYFFSDFPNHNTCPMDPTLWDLP